MPKFGLYDWLGDFSAKLRGPRFQLERVCRILRDLRNEANMTREAKERASRYFLDVVRLAAEFGSEEIVRVVGEFEGMFDGEIAGNTAPLRNALTKLQAAPPLTIAQLEMAGRICQRLGDQEKRLKLEQQLCIGLARAGEANRLLTKLLERHAERSLTKGGLEAIFRAYLERSVFEPDFPWKGFFASLPEPLLPSLHQVYGLLGRIREAAESAEIAGDLWSAIRYWMAIPETEAALRAVSLSDRLLDSETSIVAHGKAANCLWSDGNFSAAAVHFNESGQAERASDCFRYLGEFATAIQTRPALQPEWLLAIRGEVETEVQRLLAAKEYAAAARKLFEIEFALRAKAGEGGQPEADRTNLLLREVVKTGRTSFDNEVRETKAEQGAEIFKRWSLLEEAAGNFLEAGVQAEMAGDYFAAALLFVKANAFGQALSALGQTAEGSNPMRRAELLERGGDFFMAGLLYARMAETGKAIAMFDKAGEFARAGKLRREQIGEHAAVFDDQLLELLTKAGQVDSLAELCLTQAQAPGVLTEEKVALLRRVKQLAQKALVAPKWQDVAEAELAKAEAADRATFEERAGKWAADAARAVTKTYLDSFGMDLGTSNCAVALFNKETSQAEVVEWRGRPTIPSVFAIDQAGREIIGFPESELLGKSPRAIVTQAKRKIGTDTKFKANGQFLRAEEISARYISHGREVAIRQLLGKIAERISAMASQEMGGVPGDWVTEYLTRCPPEIALKKAVITVPAYFNEAQKQATRTAAILANIEILRLIHEPTAACLAQRFRGSAEPKEEAVLVVDLGAGTLDLSLITVGNGVFEVMEIEGDNVLGSSNLDELLFEYCSGIVEKQTGSKLKGLAGRRLHQACEDLKIALSTQSVWQIELPQLAGQKTVELSVDRESLERLAAPWLQRIQDTCRKIKGRPDRILLIGGGVRMPAVEKCINDVFGRKSLLASDPLTAVAKGAVIQAAILLGELKQTLVLDVVPFSLGIKSYVGPEQFKFDVLIPKHSTIPKVTTQSYTTVTDNQRVIRIQVFQGEDKNPNNNFKIGEFLLEGIMMAKAGVPKIEVAFDIDANCLLRVTARDIATKTENQIGITDTHLLSPAQVGTLKERIRKSRTQQEQLDRHEKVAASLTTSLRETSATDASKLERRCQELLQQYEREMTRYAPTPAENQEMFNIYRVRRDVESKTRLALDRWETLRKSAQAWLDHHPATVTLPETLEQMDAALVESENLVRRVRDGAHAVQEVSIQYRQWIKLIEDLPMNPEGDPEVLARHFLGLKRTEEALAHFRRLEAIRTLDQVELGLEILARLRLREEYIKFLNEYGELARLSLPDFVRLNHSVRIYSSSVVWIQLPGATGSGFVIGPNVVATNRHVVQDEAKGIVAPADLRVLGRKGNYRVESIHVPQSGPDDVAILHLTEGTDLVPLRLGFSQLVEVGERIITLGFPSPGAGGFEENLFCNAGLVNRINSSPVCTERVLEVSVELRGGISGAPILNELGEVVGLVTFTQFRGTPLQGGQMHFEKSFYAVPVQVLRRLRDEIASGCALVKR